MYVLNICMNRSSTVLSSTASVFTFLFALIWGDEQFNKWKLLGVIMAFSGSFLTSIHDAKDNNYDDNEIDIQPFQSQLWGDAAGLISAVGYGVYSVLLRILCHDEGRISMNLFLGYVGLLNMIILSPVLFWILFANDDEIDVGDNEVNATHDIDDYVNEHEGEQNMRYIRFLSSQHLTWFVLFCLIIKGLLDNVLSDFLWAKSILLTSATVATVGLGLTIPLALLSDLFIMGRADVWSVESIAGASFVLLGFIFVNIGESGKSEEGEEEGVDITFDFDESPDQVSLT